MVTLGSESARRDVSWNSLAVEFTEPAALAQMLDAVAAARSG